MTGIPTYPDINGETCVHALAPHAQCSACVDACPRQALLLDDEGLNLDTDACDGCGQCLPACPRAAIGLAPPPISHCEIRVDATALAQCREVTPGGLPCQHALGTRDLDALAKDGVRHLSVTTGTCARCPSAPRGPGLGGALALHRAVRESRGLPALTIEARAATPGTVPPRVEAPRVDRSKRRLFATLLGQRATPEPAPERLPLAYCAPKIDGTRCTGCDACARICPDHAILRQGPPDEGYRLVPDHCSACGLCVDICESDAVTLHALAGASESLLRLETRRCIRCGVPFSTPAGQDSGGRDAPTRCPICRAHPHSRQLFQVITPR